MATAAPVPKALKAKGDAERIVGTWKPAEGRTEWYRFDSDGTVTAWDVTRPTQPSTYTYALDPATTPKRMTLTEKGQKTPYFRCVYELDGDTLKMVYGTADKPWSTLLMDSGSSHRLEQTRDTSAR